MQRIIHGAKEGERVDNKTWADRSEVERTILAGLHGTPQIKPEEKRKYLGVYREQVLVMLSASQVSEKALYPEVVLALRDPRAIRIIFNGELDKKALKKYQNAAKTAGKPYNKVTGPEFDPDTGLVVVSEDAVGLEAVEAQDRSQRLLNRGISQELIDASGRAICDACYDQIIQADAGEAVNYHKMNWVDHLLCQSCPAHEKE